MSFCPNCKKKLTCGCQKKTSKNGVAGCNSCIGQLNAAAPQPKTVPTPNSPTNTEASYSGPGTQL